jgi:DNA polymerase-1
VPGLDGVKLNLVDDTETAHQLMSWLGERRPVLAVDTETSGLEDWKPDSRLRLVQFGDAKTGWSVPYDLWKGLVLEVFQKYQGDLVFHNIAFDGRWIERHCNLTLPWGRSHDTMIMHQLIDPNPPHGLKPLGNRIVDRRASAGQHNLEVAMAEQKWTWDTVPVDFGPYWQYAALDTVITANLWEAFQPQITDRFSRIYDIEMSTVRITSAMERRGARIDVAYTEEKLEELRNYVDTCRKWVVDEHGIHIGSNDKVADRLIELGIELTERTDTGRWKLDKEVLQSIIHLDDTEEQTLAVERTPGSLLAETVYNARRAQKICSTYFVNFLEGRDRNGDVVHPSIRTMGARTGRMSVTSPALQTLPRGRVVRDAFIPREGNVLISTDMDQVEMRLLAHFGQESGLKEAFLAEEDFFNVIARQIFQDPTIVKGDPRRQITKNVSYAKIYGAGHAKMALTAGVPVEHIKYVDGGLDALYPGIRRFQKEVEFTAAQRLADEGQCYVTDPFGRYQPTEPDKAYALVNYLIQSTAASLLKQSLIQMDASGLGEFLILPVHDEVILDVPKEQVDDALPIIKDCMESGGGLEWFVPLTAGVDVMEDRWGSKYAT